MGLGAPNLDRMGGFVRWDLAGVIRVNTSNNECRRIEVTRHLKSLQLRLKSANMDPNMD